MLSAAIDIGSNTLRLIIGDRRSGTFFRIHADRVITRLAEGIGKSGRLSETAMEKSLSALQSFSETISRYGVMPVYAVGTSALREAENSRQFLEDIFLKTGIRVKIISGEEEAELTLKGILCDSHLNAGSSLIIDIGGGSTEWIWNIPESRDKTLHGSLPLGVVKLREEFATADPPSARDISALSESIACAIHFLSENTGADSKPARMLIGTGGTITTLASIDLGLTSYAPDKIHRHSIPLERITAMKEMLITLPLASRQKIRGLDPDRADLIIPGILLTMIIMRNVGFSRLLVSDYGLLEGLLEGRCDENSF